MTEVTRQATSRVSTGRNGYPTSPREISGQVQIIEERGQSMLSIALNRVLGALSLIIFCIANVTATPRVADARIHVVSNLYKAYAWQVLSSSHDAFGRPLVEQEASVLRRYFDHDLTSLLIGDQRCIARTGEPCNLDFDPIFASQDPAAADLSIRSMTNGIVAVEFTYPSSGEKVRLEYRLTRSENGWRISDIRYPGMPPATLKQLLARKRSSGSK